MWAYSTGFLRFRARPSRPHNNASMFPDGTVSTIPLSISCGPRWGTDLGNTSLNRARKATMNCRGKGSSQQLSNPNAPDSSPTDSNVEVVGQHVFVRRRRTPLPLLRHSYSSRRVGRHQPTLLDRHKFELALDRFQLDRGFLIGGWRTRQGRGVRGVHQTSKSGVGRRSSK